MKLVADFQSNKLNGFGKNLAKFGGTTSGMSSGSSLQSTSTNALMKSPNLILQKYSEPL